MSTYLGVAAASSLALAGLLTFVGVIPGASRLGKTQKIASRRKAKRLPVPSDRDRCDLNKVDEDEIASAATRANAPISALLKRALDIALSICLLVFLFPLLAATAIAIRLDSSGPILYRQKRVGFHGQVFDVYKFRSMVQDAERNGAQYAAVKDERITRVGHVIRHLRIDEIPQTINVLRGEMSFVGPRPERPEFVDTLEKEILHYQSRHLVKPGITGWAQVKYEYAASTEGAREKLRYDLFYISNYTPLLDLVIVLMTVRVAVFGLGSR